MFAPWKKSYDKPRQHIKKQRSNEMDETGAIIQSDVSQKNKDQYSIVIHIYGI